MDSEDKRSKKPWRGVSSTSGNKTPTKPPLLPKKSSGFLEKLKKKSPGYSPEHEILSNLDSVDEEIPYEKPEDVFTVKTENVRQDYKLLKFPITSSFIKLSF